MGTGRCETGNGRREVARAAATVHYQIVLFRGASQAHYVCARRYQAMADATKAMHQLDAMDIAGNKIQVKIAALSPLDAAAPGTAGGAAAAMAAATQGVDLDDAVEGAPVQRVACRFILSASAQTIGVGLRGGLDDLYSARGCG